MSVTVAVHSEAELLQSDLYGTLPAKRAAVLVHGESWDALGWRDVALALCDRGVPALALNLRGYDGSSGKTGQYEAGQPWSPITDVRSATKLLRDRGAAEIALVGSSMGGHAVLGAAMSEDVECVVSVSAPVQPVPDAMSAHVRGRKLYLGTSDDRSGATPHILASFAALAVPKTLILFGGQEHSRGIWSAPYGREAIDAIVRFVTVGL